MLKRKLAMLGVMLAATSGVMAGGPDILPMVQSNWQFYLGARAGVAALNDQHKEILPVGTDYTRFGSNSALLGGVLGLNYISNSGFLMGVQVNALYNSLDDGVNNRITREGSRPSVFVENNFQFGVDGRLGYRFSHGAIPYILGGIEAGRWQHRYNSTIPFAATETLYGPKAGAGVTFPVVGNLLASLEYSHTWFGSMSRTVSRPAGEPGVVTHRFTVQQDAVLAGLDYIFNV